MCGISGILALSNDAPVEAGAVDAMAAQLVHRGPDDAGRYLDPQGRCGLGFRRLSIIDVAGGHQPLANEDGTVWVVFNGEIYNFRELRADLQRRGHKFATQTDTEVIVHLYEEHGAGCVGRLDGMFAFAVWDQGSGRLLLARDRFGKKPLVYAVHGSRLYFASELKAILAGGDVPREIDPQSLHRYLVFQYVPAPHSIYRGCAKLPPAHTLAVDAGRPLTAAPQPYWQLRPQPYRGSYRDAREELGQRLAAAVGKRLIADVPLGAFLSGGVDSSIVVALMREQGVKPLRTFTIGFPNREYDETAYARLVAESLGTEHHEHLVTPQAREILDTLAWHYDEPFADSSAIPTYYVSQWARTGVTVALTGDGGDECFAGYDRYRASRLAAALDFVPGGLRTLLARAAEILPHARPRTWTNRLYRLACTLGQSPAGRYLAWVNIFAPAMLATAYRPEFRKQIDFDEPRRWFENLYASGPRDAAEAANHADFASYLPFDLLTKVDTASMACSLECRSPLLDHELAEFALGLPARWRLGWRGGKLILRDWARRHLPPTILSRPKMGFGVPVGEWFRQELSDLLAGRVLARDGLPMSIFEAGWLRGLVEAHLSGRANHGHALWALTMLQLWSDRWRPIGQAMGA